VKEKGQVWTMFLQFFPGKNVMMIKNRYALSNRRKSKIINQTMQNEESVHFDLEANYEFSLAD
jgi:hypothetical protein